MGLDAVELVMAVEEKFGISISDEEASNALAVGDLEKLVRAKIDIADADSCLSQRAFHLIRSRAITQFGVSRRDVRPDTPLETLIPHSDRVENWRQFQVALGTAEFPELVRPHRVNVTMTILILSALVVPSWFGALHPAHFGYWMLFGVGFTTALGLILTRLTRPMKTAFKTGYKCVGDLTRFLVARYPQLVGQPRTNKWTDEEIYSLLREVIIEQLRVSSFDRKARFVQDLHID